MLHLILSDLIPFHVQFSHDGNDGFSTSSMYYKIETKCSKTSGKRTVIDNCASAHKRAHSATRKYI